MTNQNADNAALMRELPGFNGCLGRLIIQMDPGPIEIWLAEEISRCTHPHIVAQALAELAATMVFGTVKSMPPSVDKLQFLSDLRAEFEKRLDCHIRRPVSAGGLILMTDPPR